MRREALLFLFLIGCSGSGATVGDSSASDISEGKATAVEAPKPAEPVAPASALTTIECTTAKALSDGSIHTIRFTLRGEALDSEVVIDPPLPTLSSLLKSSLEWKEGKLVLAGAERTEVTLFENSDLTRGYVKASGEYSDLYCVSLNAPKR